jgi:hypothetical protein
VTAALLAMARYTWPNLRNVTHCMLPLSTTRGDISRNSAKIKNSAAGGCAENGIPAEPSGREDVLELIEGAVLGEGAFSCVAVVTGAAAPCTS